MTDTHQCPTQRLLTYDEVRQIRRDTLEKLFALASGEYSDFYYNTPNDYGCVALRFLTGRGDPFAQYAGAEKQSKFADGTTRGNGYYTFNAAAVEMFLDGMGGL